MKTFTAVLVFTAFATALAGPADSAINEFNNIDAQGGYHFGYNAGRVAHQEQRSPEGVVRGAYSYVDADGKIQIVSYTADKHNGFLVSGTNIPKVGLSSESELVESGNDGQESSPAVVQDTPEVAAARAAHSKAYSQVLARDASSNPVAVNELARPVEYTPEVAAARIEHLNARSAAIAHNAAIARNSEGTFPVHELVPIVQYHPDYAPYIVL